MTKENKKTTDTVGNMKLRTDLTSDVLILSISAMRSDGVYTRPLRIACCRMFSKNVASLSAAYSTSAFNMVLPRAISASESLGDLKYAVAAFVTYKDIVIVHIHNMRENYHLFVKR